MVETDDFRSGTARRIRRINGRKHQQKRGWTVSPRTQGRYPSAAAGCTRHCCADGDSRRAASCDDLPEATLDCLFPSHGSRPTRTTVAVEGEQGNIRRCSVGSQLPPITYCMVPQAVAPVLQQDPSGSPQGASSRRPRRPGGGPAEAARRPRGGPVAAATGAVRGANDMNAQAKAPVLVRTGALTLGSLRRRSPALRYTKSGTTCDGDGRRRTHPGGPCRRARTKPARAGW